MGKHTRAATAIILSKIRNIAHNLFVCAKSAGKTHKSGVFLLPEKFLHEISGSGTRTLPRLNFSHVSIFLIILSTYMFIFISPIYTFADTDLPTITDNQDGDDTWRGTNTGVYDVDFSDTGGSGLAYFQVQTWKNDYTLPGDWATVTANINSDSYTQDWQLPEDYWNSLPNSRYYIYVRVFDNAGNKKEMGPAFYLEKGMTTPMPYAADPMENAVIAASDVFIVAIVEAGGYECRWSLEDLAYSDMAGLYGNSTENDCYRIDGGDYGEYACHVTGLENGEEIVYIACTDESGNEHTAATNLEVTYTVDTTQMIFEETTGNTPWDWELQQQETHMFSDMDIADFNGDGQLDIITWPMTIGSTVIYMGKVGDIWLNDGTGIFNEENIRLPLGELTVSNNYLNGFPADMDGDGKLDYVLAQQLGKCRIINNGFIADEVYTEFGESSGALSVVPADIDGDGDLDVMSVESGSNKVWLNDGQGNLSDSGQSLTTAGELPPFWETVVEAVDIDNDGFVDFVDGYRNTIWKNDGAGMFSGYGTSPGKSFCSGDLDGDGDMDFMSSTAYKYTNDGTGNFSTNWSVNWTAYSGNHCFITDFDGDGDNDSYHIGGGSYYRDEPTDVVLLNNGSGKMTKNYQNLEIHSSGFLPILHPVSGDLDGDGDLDIVEQIDTDNDDLYRFYTRFNISNHANFAPSVPMAVQETNLLTTSEMTQVSLEWSAGSDPETTDSDLLTYDVRVGTHSAGCDVFCGYLPGAAREDILFGATAAPWRGSTRGNADTANSYTVDLSTGTYYWSVRTVDTTLKASNWSPEDSFIIYTEDTTPPTITDNQDGDDTLYDSDPGAVFDVDFSDTGGALLSYVEYAVWSAPGMGSGTGTEIIMWTTIAENINSDSYTTDWGVVFQALATGTNFVSVRAADFSGNMSAVATDVFYIKKDLSPPKDVTPPSDIVTVNDGMGANIDTVAFTTALSANWSESSDDESGIAAYWYAIGTVAGASDVVDWTSASTTTTITHTGLSLTASQTYYFSVKAENGAGLFSNKSNSDGLTLSPPKDVTPPSDIVTVNDGTGVDIDSVAFTTALSANWSESSDDESGIAAYWYAIGTVEGASDVVDWTSADAISASTTTTITHTGLSLTASQTYYFSMKAENGVGMYSMTSVSDGVTIEQIWTPSSMIINRGWNLVGVSIQSVSVDFDTILGESNYEIFSFNGEYTSLTAATDSIDMELASGYWIYSSVDKGSIESITGDDYTSENKVIELKTGWNMFSNPYNKAIPWADGKATVSCGELPEVYKYNGNGYSKVSPNAGNYLAPWEGYVIKADKSCNMTISK